jgi:hypothetical protein
VSGLFYGSLPSVVFVAADAITGLNAATVVAVGFGAAITALRLLRGEPVQAALSGLLGVALGAYIAYQTESARGFFLVGIWVSLALGILFLVSVLIRWPLVGVLWSLLKGGGHSWRTDRTTLHAYDAATLVFVAVFAARFVVQQWLYDENATGWLAFARIAMGYPLLAVALLVAIWAVRCSNSRSAALSIQTDSGGVIPDHRPGR